MGTRRVDCGDVFYPAPVDGEIVGTNPIWGDDSDATYADSDSIDGDALEGTVDWPAAYVDNPGGSAAVETLTIHLRASLVPGWDNAKVGIYTGTTVGLGDNDLFSIIDGDGSTQVTLTETAADYTIESTFPTAFINALLGTSFVTVVPQSVNTTARIYELWFEVGFPTTFPSPLRRYPNASGRGIGPTRHYPPPESRRLAGGIR